MPSPMNALRLGLAVALSAAVLGNTAQAQEHGSVHVTVHVPDSVAHIVDRSTLAKANFAIVSRDGAAALLLMDTTIIAEMTDTGLARMNSRESTDTIKGTVNRLFARMALGALQPLSTTASPTTCATWQTLATPTAGCSSCAPTAKKFSVTPRSVTGR